MTDRSPTLVELTDVIRAFNEERSWAKFHDPKSLILGLVGEVGELAELFQWVSAGAAHEVFTSGERQARAAEELSDVLVYLLRLADVLQVDLGDAVQVKIAAARERFPVASYEGVAPVKK